MGRAALHVAGICIGVIIVEPTETHMGGAARAMNCCVYQDVEAVLHGRRAVVQPWQQTVLP